jgi:coproporphyrinogen III oxidase-like Fe-S oxidoreductase
MNYIEKQILKNRIYPLSIIEECGSTMNKVKRYVHIPQPNKICQYVERLNQKICGARRDFKDKYTFKTIVEIGF